MKVSVVALAIGILLPCGGGAQSNSDREVRFEFGSTLNAVLSDTLDARKNKSGDSVKAKISEDVLSGGVVVLPRGAKLIGHVTEAHAAAKADEQARLGFVFERAELKDGRAIPLHTAFYALAAPVGAADNSPPSAGGGSFGGGFGGTGSGVGGMARAAGDDTSALDAGNGKHAELKPSPGAIGGLNGSGTLFASSRGVFGIEDVSLEPNSTPSNGSGVILANARNVRLSSGTRMLLSVTSPEKP